MPAPIHLQYQTFISCRGTVARGPRVIRCYSHNPFLEYVHRASLSWDGSIDGPKDHNVCQPIRRDYCSRGVTNSARRSHQRSPPTSFPCDHTEPPS
ncbi:hypothetical protein BD311DRAFT_47199 [Dichomitus squalens]|uniref:Uncharacterized protein n=1 Tax=Dichomitus squalens TaxID=114155 RepID=A0A4Q9MDI9_9APHY|nr:hypothetical protein BD311DRAFT_47199 [Dichomitus squalens]